MLLIRSVGLCLLMAAAFVLYKGESVVNANTVTGNAAIIEPQPFAPVTCDYYASPNGLPTGIGTLSNPWSLHTALNSPTLIVAGKTLCLQGGTYSGKFKSILNGGTVRAAPNEYPVIDGYVSTTLVGDMDPLQTTITVADASKFVNSWRYGGATSLIVDGEALYINGFTGNTIRVNRAAAGSSTLAVPHLSGTTVRLAGNQLYSAGNNTTFQEIEIRNSDPLRNWVTDGAEGLRGTGIFNTGDGNKFVNLIVHDNLSGIFSGSSSSNTEVYGTLSYNNGMFDNTDQGKGHGMYLENAAGYSRIYDNIVVNNFGLGAQCYGRTAAYPGGDIQGNVFSNSGSPLGYFRHYNLLVGTETQRIADISVQNNYLYHPHDLNGYNMTLGYGAGVDRGSILNNYFVGGGGIGLELLDVTDVTVTGNKFNTTNPLGVNIQSRELPYTVNTNKYYSVQPVSREFGDSTVSQTLTFASWKTITGFDSTSIATVSPMPDTVIVRPNTYTPGRANVIVYTSSGASSVSLNLSATGITDGQPYTIKNAFNYSGQAVATGVYSSTSPTISLPLNGVSTYVATPVGATYTPTTTSPQFGVFIVIPAIIPSPSPTNTPTATFTSTPTFTPTPTFTSTATFTPTPTFTATATFTPTLTPTFTPTFTPTATPVSFVTGAVTYGNAVGSPNQRFVSNVLVSAVGSPPVSVFTDYPNGLYSLGVGLGIYTITPSKTGGHNGAISSFDAARISQFVSSNTTFTAAQQSVADVSGNGIINSFDAAQVARYAITTPPYGSTGSWVFNPSSRTFTLATLNISGADYSASLMGEVSGNWNNTGARPGGPDKGADIVAPSLVTAANAEVIVPVSVKGIADQEIISYEFDLRYDPLIIQPQVDVIDLEGTVSSGLKAVANSSEPGLLRVAVYGPLPINSDGVLFNLKFNAVGLPGSISPLVWERIMLNEGDLQINVTDGQVEISSISPPFE